MDQDREDHIRKLIRNHYRLHCPNSPVPIDWMIPAIQVPGTTFYHYKIEYGYAGFPAEKTITRFLTRKTEDSVVFQAKFKYNFTKMCKGRRYSYDFGEFLTKFINQNYTNNTNLSQFPAQIFLKLTEYFKEEHNVPPEIWTSLIES